MVYRRPCGVGGDEAPLFRDDLCDTKVCSMTTETLTLSCFFSKRLLSTGFVPGFVLGDRDRAGSRTGKASTLMAAVLV